MNYIENIYICIAAPLIVSILCLRGRRRRSMLFFLGGMTGEDMIRTTKATGNVRFPCLDFL